MDPTETTTAPAGTPEHDLVAAFQNYPVYLTAIVIVAIMTTAKKAARILSGKSVEEIRNPWIEVAIQIGNVPLGVAFGLIPGFLPGQNCFERMMIGAVAGFMSNTLYSIAKRFLPGLMESDAPEVSIPAAKAARAAQAPAQADADSGAEATDPTIRTG